MWGALILLMGFSANALTAEQVLKTAQDDSAYVLEGFRDLNSANPLRNVEGFASVERDNGKSEVEVGLKLQFRSWPEWRLRKDVHSEQSHLKRASLAWALRERYATLIVHVINQEKIRILKDALRLSEDYLKGQALSLRAGLSTPKSLLDAQNDLYKMRRLENVLNQENSQAVQRIKRWVPGWGEGEIETFELISVQDIQELLTESVSVDASFTSKISDIEKSQLSRELEILRARENQWIKGLELSQVQKKDETGYKVEVSLQLPGLGSDDLSRQKQNELIVKRVLKEKERDEGLGRAAFLKTQLVNLIGLYKLSQTTLEGSLKARGRGPLSVLENQMIQAQNRLELLGQQQEILTLFVDYLLESELLTENPQINQLRRKEKGRAR